MKKQETNIALGFSGGLTGDYSTIVLCTPAVELALKKIKEYGYLNTADLQRKPKKNWVSEIKKAVGDYRTEIKKVVGNYRGQYYGK